HTWAEVAATGSFGRDLGGTGSYAPGMTARTADRLAPFGVTIFAEMSRLAAECGAVNLSQGFPDFDGPEFVKRAHSEAVAAGHNQYAPMGGVPALQRAIAEWHAADWAGGEDGDRGALAVD